MKKLYFFCHVSEIELNKFLVKPIKNMNIGGIKMNEKFYFIHDYCPHAGAPICKGKIEKVHIDDNETISIRCPWHNWMFKIENGQHVLHQIKQKLVCLDFEIISDVIYVKC